MEREVVRHGWIPGCSSEWVARRANERRCGDVTRVPTRFPSLARRASEILHNSTLVTKRANWSWVVQKVVTRFLGLPGDGCG